MRCCRACPTRLAALPRCHCRPTKTSDRASVMHMRRHGPISPVTVHMAPFCCSSPATTALRPSIHISFSRWPAAMSANTLPSRTTWKQRLNSSSESLCSLRTLPAGLPEALSSLPILSDPFPHVSLAAPPVPSTLKKRSWRIRRPRTNLMRVPPRTTIEAALILAWSSCCFSPAMPLVRRRESCLLIDTISSADSCRLSTTGPSPIARCGVLRGRSRALTVFTSLPSGRVMI
mmetsp:Transcript_4904/g.10392  ORF Transcript_4904/g.10392 Transcript_4904/m.10392 type:complete len:232 (-) Transcript_4904:181-876(-)